MNHPPLEGTGSPEKKSKIRMRVNKRCLVGAADNTKCNKLINFMRQQEKRRTSYRFKWISHFSTWDLLPAA